MTEMSPGSHTLRETSKNTKIGSCGVPIPNTLCKIVATDGSGKILGANQRGEVCVKGPQVMKGYLNNEEATRNTIDGDNWLHTGDIGYYDDDQHFYIVDRLKELIKVKGFQVAPAELEELLRSHPDIADAAVIGIDSPDAGAGELPRAYIVKKDSNNAAALTDEKIHAFINAKVTNYKQLRGGIEVINVIPKATSGKILRRELKKAYCEKYGIKM
jgi:acyl-CoA synthetase (AMP-forming)/AMP-acid ligase II